MLPFNDGKHAVYGPDTLQVMGAEFDGAVQLLHPLHTEVLALKWNDYVG